MSQNLPIPDGSNKKVPKRPSTRAGLHRISIAWSPEDYRELTKSNGPSRDGEYLVVKTDTEGPMAGFENEPN